MNADHDALRLALGGYVLGTLSPAETEQVRAHLERCGECWAEHAELAGLPALLATVTAAETAGSWCRCAQCSTAQPGAVDRLRRMGLAEDRPP